MMPDDLGFPWKARIAWKGQIFNINFLFPIQERQEKAGKAGKLNPAFWIAWKSLERRKSGIWAFGKPGKAWKG